MRILVCGAGRVGSGIAKALARDGADVSAIDVSPELIQDLTETTDVLGVVGHASYPDVLAEAGAREAELIIAVTASDEVNIVAVQVARHLFDVPIGIARVRGSGFHTVTWSDVFSRDHLHVDVAISPEREVAQHVVQRLHNPGAFETVSFADGKIECVGAEVTEEASLVATPFDQLSDLFPDLHARIVAISRTGRLFTPDPTDQIEPHDRVYFVSERTHVGRMLELMGHTEQEARKILVIGGGNIGLATAQLLEARRGFKVRMIEATREQAEKAAEALNRSVVLHGSGLERSILREAGVDEIETVLALTNSDEVNLISAALARREGAERAMALITNRDYRALAGDLNINAYVDPQEITVSSVLRHVRKGRIKSLVSIEDGAAEVIEAVALKTSPLANESFSTVETKPGIALGSIMRKGEILNLSRDGTIQAGDHVILLALKDRVRDVERMFRVSAEYF
jgi:trk system potassium uptake protein TrkA